MHELSDLQALDMAVIHSKITENREILLKALQAYDGMPISYKDYAERSDLSWKLPGAIYGLYFDQQCIRPWLKDVLRDSYQDASEFAKYDGAIFGMPVDFKVRFSGSVTISNGEYVKWMQTLKSDPQFDLCILVFEGAHLPELHTAVTIFSQGYSFRQIVNAGLIRPSNKDDTVYFWTREAVNCIMLSKNSNSRQSAKSLPGLTF